jgi:hypothetical protein
MTTNCGLTIFGEIIMQVGPHRKMSWRRCVWLQWQDGTGWNGPSNKIVWFRVKVGTGLSQCCPKLSLKIGGTREDARGRPCPGCPATKRTSIGCGSSEGKCIMYVFAFVNHQVFREEIDRISRLDSRTIKRGQCNTLMLRELKHWHVIICSCIH